MPRNERMKDHVLPVPLSPTLYEQLRKRAYQTRQSMASIVRAAIAAHLGNGPDK